jgi:mannose-6-phosphate isomerase
MLCPLVFRPIFKERVWGGRNLERLFGKALPPGVPIGESWEITDRPEGVSVVVNGPLAGKDLRWLMEHAAEPLLGRPVPEGARFPWLIKLLDAEQALSLQVHPPVAVAARLGAEPKTEMWYIADARPGAELFVGLRRQVDREVLERRVREGTVAECFHRIPVKEGDAMFLPSGRVHALGAGLVIFEVQQNSDTTYRVFDWNRMGLDGRPRELHVVQSLASIDFNDVEPGLIASTWAPEGPWLWRSLVHDPLFEIDVWRSEGTADRSLAGGRMRVLAVVQGTLRISGHGETLEVGRGGFCLLAAALVETSVTAVGPVAFLEVRATLQA